MILDNIKNASLYYGLGERIALGLKYLNETNFESIAPGKYEIDGINVYATVSNNDSVLIDNGKWEGHRKYIDIQYIVSGAERIGYAHISEMQSVTEYSEDWDMQFFNGKGDFLHVNAGGFVIFAPEDIHMPSIAVEKPSAVKKVTVKVLV